MINHSRTLLLNRDGASRPSVDFYLEEFVDPSFNAVVLPGYLSSLHRILMGNQADNAFANFRARQYMQILHSTDLSSFVYDLDPRVTYLDKVITADAVNRVDVDPVTVNAEGIPLVFVNTPDVGAKQRLIWNWDATVTGAAEVQTKSLQTFEENLTTVTFSNNITSLVQMVSQPDFFMRIGAGSLIVGQQWRVESFTAPSYDLTDVTQALESGSANALLRLFSTEEPYKSFKQLWEDHPSFSYRLSGILLAFIYRVEEVRTGA